MRGLFPECSVVDRRSDPSFGYRAVHLVTAIEKRLVEVQVRTTLQHRWAELSEKFSDEVDPAIKYGGGDHEITEWLLDQSSFILQVEMLELEISKRGEEVGRALRTQVDALKANMAESLTEMKEKLGRLRGGNG